MPDTNAPLHAIELIQRPSTTPDDRGCQDYLESVLEPLGFTRTCINTGGITNSIYQRRGEKTGCLAFVGHTDVVPCGPVEQWPHPPFAAVIENDVLHGRGAQDMKGGIACWLAALEQLIEKNAPLPSMQLLITSDEEGESIDGTIRIVEALQEGHTLPDAAIVGEPSSSEEVGDVIRRGRRGVVQVTVLFKGKQGHSAYPHDATNAVHLAAPVLNRITHTDWGETTPGFPPTTCQITNIQAGTGAINVIPGTCSISLDIRYNPGIDFDGIRKRLYESCDGVDAALDIRHQARAFSTPDGVFLDLVESSIRRVTGIVTKRDTGGGTSDGRFLAAAGIPVAELGLTNSTIHQIGECVAVAELEALTNIYIDIMIHFGASCKTLGG